MELERKAIEDQIKRLISLRKSLDKVDGCVTIFWQQGFNTYYYELFNVKKVVIELVKIAIDEKIELRTKELGEL